MYTIIVKNNRINRIRTVLLLVSIHNSLYIIIIMIMIILIIIIEYNENDYNNPNYYKNYSNKIRRRGIIV